MEGVPGADLCPDRSEDVEQMITMEQKPQTLGDRDVTQRGRKRVKRLVNASKRRRVRFDRPRQIILNVEQHRAIAPRHLLTFGRLPSRSYSRPPVRIMPMETNQYSIEVIDLA